MLAYSTFDPAKSLDAADRLLQVDPNNLRGLTFETYFRLSGADSITDPTAKQAALDKAADYAQKGLVAPKPADMPMPTSRRCRVRPSLSSTVPLQRQL